MGRLTLNMLLPFAQFERELGSKATDTILIKALSRAWRWQKMLDACAYGSIAEMADKEGINRSYLSRTIRLALLAPDIVEAILSGTQPETPQLSDLERPFPIDWEAQRTAFGFRARSALERNSFSGEKLGRMTAHAVNSHRL